MFHSYPMTQENCPAEYIKTLFWIESAAFVVDHFWLTTNHPQYNRLDVWKVCPFSQSPKYILRSPLFCQHANLDCFHLLTILVSPKRAGRHSQDAFPGPRGEHRHSQERAGISSPIEEQNWRSAAVHSQDLDFSRRRILSNQTFFFVKWEGKSESWVTTETWP